MLSGGTGVVSDGGGSAAGSGSASSSGESSSGNVASASGIIPSASGSGISGINAQLRFSTLTSVTNGDKVATITPDVAGNGSSNSTSSSAECLADTNGTATGPIRFIQVIGFETRTNDIVYCPPMIRPAAPSESVDTVVFFGGDVQDFPENMETNRDSKSYIKYNLESTAMLLRAGFPKSHILIVRPARMEFKTFSCFDNFVRGNNAGIPDHTPMHNALIHLEGLLQSVTQRLNRMDESDLISQMAAAHSRVQQSFGNNDSPQDMDIDILHVQETTVTATGDTTTSALSANADTNNESGIFMCSKETSPCQTLSLSIPSSNDLTPELLETDIQNSESHTAATAAPAATANVLRANVPVELLMNDEPLWWRENLNLNKTNLTLIGFSKGCVVLNQFIYEFHYLKTLTPDDSTMMGLVSRIKDMYWLDGGHGGSKNTWITSRSLLETLTRLNINIHVHVTPYQVQDDRRPWIRKEEKTFTDLLRKLGAKFTRSLHFYDLVTSVASLFIHFDVLQVFRQQINDQQPAIAQQNDHDDEK